MTQYSKEIEKYLKCNGFKFDYDKEKGNVYQNEINGKRISVSIGENIYVFVEAKEKGDWQEQHKMDFQQKDRKEQFEEFNKWWKDNING